MPDAGSRTFSRLLDTATVDAAYTHAHAHSRDRRAINMPAPTDVATVNKEQARVAWRVCESKSKLLVRAHLSFFAETFRFAWKKNKATAVPACLWYRYCSPTGGRTWNILIGSSTSTSAWASVPINWRIRASWSVSRNATGVDPWFTIGLGASCCATAAKAARPPWRPTRTSSR